MVRRITQVEDMTFSAMDVVKIAIFIAAAAGVVIRFEIGLRDLRNDNVDLHNQIAVLQRTVTEKDDLLRRVTDVLERYEAPALAGPTRPVRGR